MKYQYINAITQFGVTDVELLLLGDKDEILYRSWRQFPEDSKPDVLDEEAQRTIDIFLNTPPPEKELTPDEKLAQAVAKAKKAALEEAIAIVSEDKNVDPKTLDALNQKLAEAAATEIAIIPVDVTPVDVTPVEGII